ncbi:unnamed protein product, partial [Prorocentrum cordatum]
MGNTLATDTIPLLVTMVDVHNPKAQDQFYFCNVSSGGASTKVIGRSQTLSVEVGITTILRHGGGSSCTSAPSPSSRPRLRAASARCACPSSASPSATAPASSSSGSTSTRLRTSKKNHCAGDPQMLVSKFEQAYTDAVVDVYQPKICISVIGTAFEVQRDSRSAFNIFVGEDVKTQAGPDLKALIASHKQQAAYIDALHEELRRVNVPSYRAMPGSALGFGAPVSAQPLKTMAPEVGIPTVMLVENMSYFDCGGCSARHFIFGEGGGKRLAQMFGIESFHQLPIDPVFNSASRESSDGPVLARGEHSAPTIVQAMHGLVAQLDEEMDRLAASRGSRPK